MPEETVSNGNESSATEVLIPAGKSVVLNTIQEPTVTFLVVFLFALIISVVVFDGSLILPFLASTLAALGTIYGRRSQSMEISWALRADSQGVFDNTGLPIGLMRWEEITSIESVSWFGLSFLVLKLHDRPTVIKRLPPSKRWIMSLNTFPFGNRAVIAPYDIGVSVEEARDTLQMAQHRFTTISSPAPVPLATTKHWWTAVPPEDRKAIRITQRGAADSDR